MTVEAFQQAIATTRTVLAKVTREQLDAPTPCASWKVRDLINHIVGGQYFFKAGVEGTPGGEQRDFSAGDFVASFDEASAAAVAAFSADGALQKMLILPFGQMPGAAFLGLAATDTLVHGWDLAKAIGQPTDLAPDLAASLLAQSKMAIQDAFRGPDGVAPFGTEKPAPAGASNADRLAAFLGRSV